MVDRTKRDRSVSHECRKDCESFPLVARRSQRFSRLKASRESWLHRYRSSDSAFLAVSLSLSSSLCLSRPLSLPLRLCNERPQLRLIQRTVFEAAHSCGSEGQHECRDIAFGEPCEVRPSESAGAFVRGGWIISLWKGSRAHPERKSGRYNPFAGLLEIIPEVFLLICRRIEIEGRLLTGGIRECDTRRRDVAAKKALGKESINFHSALLTLLFQSRFSSYFLFSFFSRQSMLWEVFSSRG